MGTIVSKQKKELENILEGDNVLLTSILLKEKSHFILQTPDGKLHHSHSDFGQKEVAKLATNWYEEISDSANWQYREKSEKIYDLILRPFESIINRENPRLIVFVHDGILRNIPMAALHVGSPEDDIFDSENPDEKQFEGENQILLTGSGNDFVDITFAPGGEKSRIDLGSGDDILFGRSNHRIIAGDGDDLLFLGSGEGNNIISGGEGNDTFFLITDVNVTPQQSNIITDFDPNLDTFGFANSDLSFDDLNLTFNGDRMTINALRKDLAIVTGIEATSLNSSNFIFV